MNKKSSGNAVRNGLLKHYGHQCCYCLRELTVRDSTIEHVVPRGHGGNNYLINLRPCCGWCNNLLCRLEKSGLLVVEDVQMKRIRLVSILEFAIELQFQANVEAIRKYSYLFADEMRKSATNCDPTGKAN